MYEGTIVPMPPVKGVKLCRRVRVKYLFCDEQENLKVKVNQELCETPSTLFILLDSRQVKTKHVLMYKVVILSRIIFELEV